METRVAINKRSTKKVEPVEPFAEIVEAPAVKKRAKNTEATAPKPVQKVRRATKATTNAAPLDPFAEMAGPVTSPVKKAAKTVKAKPAKATPSKKAPAAKVKTQAAKAVKDPTLDVTAEIAAAEPKVEVSLAFKALADVELPELKRENRARLQMQSPTKLNFYWSVKENPWTMLRDAFGSDTGSYTLILKLKDIKQATEEIQHVETQGDYWFDVEPDGEYQAEIGFYAPNRPYFRVVYSNTITTPRRTPSPHPASDARWTLSANKFAEVLDVAGFSRDAFDVALAGDDIKTAKSVTHKAFASMTGYALGDLYSVSAADIRYAMIALASGRTLEELRDSVSPALFAILQSTSGSITRKQAMGALTEHFDIDETEFEHEELGPAVFGASLISFPKTLKTKKLSPKYAPRYNPVSSTSTGW